jgi:hypothetical protein
VPTPLPGQDLFCPPILWFCRKEKKNMTFFLVWEKKYRAFPCDISMHICVIPQMVYLLSPSTFCFSTFLMLVSASLRFLHSSLYRVCHPYSSS